MSDKYKNLTGEQLDDLVHIDMLEANVQSVEQLGKLEVTDNFLTSNLLDEPSKDVEQFTTFIMIHVPLPMLSKEYVTELLTHIKNNKGLCCGLSDTHSRIINCVYGAKINNPSDYTLMHHFLKELHHNFYRDKVKEETELSDSLKIARMERIHLLKRLQFKHIKESGLNPKITSFNMSMCDITN